MSCRRNAHNISKSIKQRIRATATRRGAKPFHPFDKMNRGPEQLRRIPDLIPRELNMTSAIRVKVVPSNTDLEGSSTKGGHSKASKSLRTSFLFCPQQCSATFLCLSCIHSHRVIRSRLATMRERERAITAVFHAIEMKGAYIN